MHMADALLSPAVGISMYAVSAGAIAYSAAKVKKDELSDNKVPVMAVAGAFVFAAQMINFTIPATGSSGHIGGGILAASILGAYPALLSMTAVLIIQCLFFADGGLLALGCNIFNMGVIPCLIIYPLIFKPILRSGVSSARIAAACIISIALGLELGALSVVIETLLSGVAQLPFGAFVTLMLPIHLAIGLIEGIVTAAVVCYVWKLRPEILESSLNSSAVESDVSIAKPVIALLIGTVLLGGAVSIYASSNPDGLEWAIGKTAGTTELEAAGGIYDSAADIQESTAFMPDYNFSNADEESSAAGTSTAGLLGGTMTLILAGTTGFVISKIKRRQASTSI